MAIKAISSEDGSFLGFRVTLKRRFGQGVDRSWQRKWPLLIKTEKEAKKIEKMYEREAAKAIAIFHEKGIIWRDLLEKYMLENKEVYQGKRKSYVAVSQVLSKWTKLWMHRPVIEISKIDGHELFKRLRVEGLSVSYQKKIRQIIKKVINWAILERYLPEGFRSPVSDIKFRKSAEKEPEVLSLDDAQKLLTESKRRQHEYYPIWVMSLLTGARAGELRALRWEHINFENKTIRINYNYNPNESAIGPTKTSKLRTVPISSDLKDFLTDYKVKTNDGFEFDEFGDDYILPRLNAFMSGNQSEPLRRFCSEIGIRNVKHHALRSTAATHLLNDPDTTIPQLMAIMGWSSLDTASIYIRLSGIEVRGVTERLKFLENKEKDEPKKPEIRRNQLVLLK